MLVASQLPFRQVIGIELNPDMADIAQQNLDLWLASHAADTTAPKIAPTRLLQQDALEFDLPRTPTLAFLFHPFEAPSSKPSSAASRPSSQIVPPPLHPPSTSSTSTQSAAPSSIATPHSPVYGTVLSPCLPRTMPPTSPPSP